MTEELTSRQRELLEGAAAAVYELALEDGGITADDPRITKRASSRAAFELLVELGLLSPTGRSGWHQPVDPMAVQAHVVAPMGQRAADLLSESSKWADTFANLGQSFRRSTADRIPVREIRGLANINGFLSTTIDDARHELLTAQPTLGRSTGSLENASKRDIRAVTRGISMRTLYQHSARRSAAINDYVAQVTPYGAEIRTLEEFFNRMIVVDRMVAVVPGADAPDVAIAIHEPSLVAYLVDVFERHWERARPFEERDRQTAKNIAEDTRNMTIRMLIEGHSDPASAKRLGVSTRTYAGYVATLKSEFESETRFQLGYKLGRGGFKRADASDNAAGQDGV